MPNLRPWMPTVRLPDETPPTPRGGFPTHEPEKARLYHLQGAREITTKHLRNSPMAEGMWLGQGMWQNVVSADV